MRLSLMQYEMVSLLLTPELSSDIAVAQYRCLLVLAGQLGMIFMSWVAILGLYSLGIYSRHSLFIPPGSIPPKYGSTAGLYGTWVGCSNLDTIIKVANYKTLSIQNDTFNHIWHF